MDIPHNPPPFQKYQYIYLYKDMSLQDFLPFPPFPHFENILPTHQPIPSPHLTYPHPFPLPLLPLSLFNLHPTHFPKY